MVIWGLWKSRNDLVWRSVSIPSAKIVSLALGFYNQWWDALGQHTSVLSNQDVYSASRWRKLASGFFKYNTDATMIPMLV